MSIGATGVLNDVSLDIKAGEIVAITGESGSGKSMTALSVMQLLPSGATVAGQITLDGTALLATGESQLCALRGRQMGMVFQEPMTALNPVQTIGAQVLEVIRIHRTARGRAAQQMMHDVLTRVGLPPDKIPVSRYPHELSGGQRQRVVIAMAVVLRPKLLIADEPTTALDVTTQAQILDLLRDLVATDGMGLMMITHDLAVVSELADRIVVMRHGQVVEAGPTADILHNPQHPYTKMLRKAASHRVDLPDAQLPDARLNGTDDTPLLQVTDAQRIYPAPMRLFGRRPAKRAVNNVSFDLHRSERLGLVGESGSGKSTLMRAILGLEPLQSGRIAINGRDIASPTNERLNSVQVVFQDPYGSFNPRHRVGRLIAEPFHNHPNPPNHADRAALVSATLHSVGLRPQDADRFIHEFSGGQRQRIAIARALITQPDLILLDEAVSALDVSVRAQILDLLADLCRDTGLTYLFVSHDLSVIREVTDRVLVMKDGEIVEQGDTETVFTAPAHPYTKRLLAASPRLPDIMNEAP
jgi:peptide/nickel transport system ATP-binding protein